jgi:hypothetical protein
LLLKLAPAVFIAGAVALHFTSSSFHDAEPRNQGTLEQNFSPANDCGECIDLNIDLGGENETSVIFEDGKALSGFDYMASLAENGVVPVEFAQCYVGDTAVEIRDGNAIYGSSLTGDIKFEKTGFCSWTPVNGGQYIEFNAVSVADEAVTFELPNLDEGNTPSFMTLNRN